MIGFAAPASITYTYEHHIFTLLPRNFPDWSNGGTVWMYQGIEATPTFCTTDCDTALPPSGWTKKQGNDWNAEAIGKAISEKISAKFEREAGKVSISKAASGAITFEGVGLPGRKVILTSAVARTVMALKENVTHVVLPVEIIQPEMTVSPELAALGIKEVVTVGESDWTGSTKNRRHNIGVGLAKFNGHLIPQGTVFSFVETLGPVDARTGYLRELVIKGDRTVPDYGGGLCQVSSTAYRGIWEYGFPIKQRKNHSYTVSYYYPQGTDATVYPPNVDMKFLNDSPGAILIQTYVDDPTKHAYFIYYGTKDTRKAEVFGPYIWSTRAAPAEKKIEYTTDLPPGEEKKLGERVPGASASWFRSVTASGTGTAIQETFSSYEARPLFYQVGVAELPTSSGSTLEGADIIVE